MSDEDARRWDARWRTRAAGAATAFVERVLAEVTPPGRALDLAGGRGRHALALAARGFDVLLVDVSAVALAAARRDAAAAGLALETRRLDLETTPPPPGPWDLVLLVDFLDRDLLRAVPPILAPGGRLVVSLATVRNLERHERPGRRHLLAEGELPSLLGALVCEVLEEGWGPEGRHEARAVARRPAGSGET